MITQYTSKDFKVMPWSNGGGVTTELYLQKDPYYFRLSVATVSQDGPFSIFPNIDRTLMLLEGNGFTLIQPNEKIVLNNLYTPINFSGEEIINCKLINGICIDFNVMIDRNSHYRTEIVWLKDDTTITNCNEVKFIYDHSCKELWKLEKNTSKNFQKKSSAPIIVVTLL